MLKSKAKMIFEDKNEIRKRALYYLTEIETRMANGAPIENVPVEVRGYIIGAGYGYTKENRLFLTREGETLLTLLVKEM
ncbi:MAG: hypothetical protein CMH64_00430 [Nanoarchaeota archaeon]|nr:hypothetical protein [Nanoarchaeota archaeon]|tara:strand:- start:1227 stop:1463 length:237 start_codon:yes stop_codon:yes gene_type:complete